MRTVVNVRDVSRSTGRSPIETRQWVGRVAAPLILVILWFLPMHQAPTAQHAVAISAAMIVLWATEAITHAATGLLGLTLFWVLGVSPLPVVLSGFRQPTVWFLVGALLIGIMATRSGLAQRLAYGLASRLGTSYSRLVLAFLIVDCCLTFLIPSGIARVAILSSVVVGLVQALGLDPRGHVARALLIVVTYSAGIFDKMILAGAASILGRGLIESATGIAVPYAQWFVAYLPCTVLTIFVFWRLILWLYPAETDTLGGSAAYLRERLTRLGGWSRLEQRAAMLILLAVALWMTDFAHHFRPSTVALAVGVLGFVPGIGVLVPRDLRDLRVGVVVFTAAALGMSAVLTESNGLEILTRFMASWLPPVVGGQYASTLVFYWTAFVCHFFLGSETAMLSATLLPVLDFARTQGLAQLPIGMIWIFASGGKIFVYQSAVLMVGYAHGYFDAKDLMKVGILLSIIECAILLVLVPLYWPLVGIE